ncbi:TonB-dependent receptor [Methylocapsa palsarum]|uniref:Iron complex outermembrane recepter protein n=1 Tax=Methylocapsa palsarum TaxID=1612308 RepID=A0A1I3XG67_9HYPH|nr:TonB-dependent receptor [Methylocapsa palsarum]SFK18502.1 iron complex outermembrane recepter protein [Methylocapsa palsarum]
MRRELHLSTISTLSGVFCLCASAPAFAQTAAPFELPEVSAIATTPVPGPGEDRDKFPSSSQTITAPDFARTRSPNVTDAIDQRTPGVFVDDINGNPFSQELQYRGFFASPQQGTPQGLAVYQNGIRINEAFGDTVNWDLIPPQAIRRTDVFTGNPIFGLNALGGAINIEMKNGFNWQGLEAQVLGGSYGRVSGLFEYGKQIDNYSVYVTADTARDGGWRYFSPSWLARAYGDVGYRSQDAELHLIASGAASRLGVIGPTPVELLSPDIRNVFTSPQTTANEAGSLALTGRFDIVPHWSLSSNFYLRTFKQTHTDGNDADVQDCGSNNLPNDFAGSLCLSDDGFPSVANGNGFVILDQHGNPISFSGNTVYGTIDRTFTHSTTAGAAVQATNKDQILGHDNYLVVGGSVDASFFSFSANSTLGVINPNFVVSPDGSFPGAGATIETLGRIGYVPTFLTGTTTYWGLFALDTFNLTPELALTAGARLNVANIDTNDAGGLSPELNSANTFTRVNPVAGLTYKILPGVSAYASYSEANRAPTPLELDCASKIQPCLLANSLVADPPLQQVVSHTVEAGLRGTSHVLTDGRIDWKAGFFRTNVSNDIISLASTITGRGYYANVPGTLRQGVEAGVEFHSGDWLAYLNYSYVDATYRFSGALASPNNPFADADGNIFVTPGNRIPGIPSQQIKFGADYSFTPQFKLGGDVRIVGTQYFIGDDSNQNSKLPAFWVANLHASYQVSEHFQIFGLINNLFNNHSATYGTFFDTGTGAQNAVATNFTTDARTITPMQPLSLYAGFKVTF